MKLWKSSILFVSVAVMLLSSMAVSADETESDPTGDVAHWEYTANNWGWNYNIGNKPNIDITELSYSASGGKLTVTIKVDGTIQTSGNFLYYIMMNTSDANYLATWSEGEGGGFATSVGDGEMKYDFDPEVEASGGTLYFVFNETGSDYSSVEFWGYAAEYVEMGDVSAEWWGDWAPETSSPFWGEGGDGDGDEEHIITVTSPNSGDTWYQGGTNAIGWSSENAGSYVDIDLYQDEYFHSIIALSISNDGSYSWTVPSGLSTDSYYEILITDSSDSSVYGYSGYLSIQKSSGLNFQEWIIIIAVFMVISLIIIIVVIVVIKGNPKGLPKEYQNRDTEEKLNKIKEKVKQWKKEGYNVDEIEQKIKSHKER